MRIQKLIYFIVLDKGIGTFFRSQIRYYANLLPVPGWVQLFGEFSRIWIRNWAWILVKFLRRVIFKARRPERLIHETEFQYSGPVHSV
jgi:hypothetical protein